MANSKICEICNKEFVNLGTHMNKAHGMTLQEYKKVKLLLRLMKAQSQK